MDRFLVTGAINPADNICKSLSELGFEVDYIANELEPLQVDMSCYTAVVCNSLFMHNDITKFSNLRFIHLTSAGLDRVPLDKINEMGVKLYNAKGVYSVPMAEWVIGSILSLYKNFNHFFKAQESHSWLKCRDIKEVCGSRGLVVGLGSVGVEIARRLCGMGVSVDGVDVVEVNSEYVDRCYLVDELKDIISDYDIVILSLPLTEATHGMFNSDMFSAMKSSALFVNVSRGGVVNQGSLIDSLQNKTIWGAALDVFDSEPLDASSPLWDMDNVMITPHNSFVSNRNRDRLEQLILTNVKENYE